MRFKVIKKQENSDECIVCGYKNDASLKADFYELENQEVVSFFEMQDFHQSYPQRAHGGMIAAILDETIGRAIKCFEPEGWGVTVELNIKYKKPTPLGIPLKAVGRITTNRSRLFEGTGELYLPDGQVAVSAKGTYIKMRPNKITNMNMEDGVWVTIESENQLEYVDLYELEEAKNQQS